MTQEPEYPTVGELQRTLTQRIQALYRQHLEHQPSRITCQLFDRALLVLMEDALTQPELLLERSGHPELVATVRNKLEQVIQPQLKALVETVLDVPVQDVLNDSKVETGRSGLIFILTTMPKVRNPRAIPNYNPRSGS